MITIDCYLSVNCPSKEALMVNIQEALRLEGITTAVVNFYHVTKQEAVALGLKGSPSVLINKIDIQPIDITGFS